MQKNKNTQFWLQAFKNFLHTQKLSKNTVKNYLADVKKFLNSSLVQAQLTLPTATANQFFSKQNFDWYHQQLTNKVKNGSLKPKVANRRLASLRNFGQFLQTTRRINLNPARALTNLPKLSSSGKALAYKNRLKQEKYLPRGVTRLRRAAHTPLGLGISHIQTIFKTYLINQKASKATIKNYLADSRQFLNWLITNY